MERVNWNQAVRPSTHDLIAAINSGADDIERIDGALDDIETVLDGKAGVSGTYPDFVAGEALSIRSGIRSNTFLTRALDSDVADGIAEVDCILGNTVVWNQPVKIANRNASASGVTFVESSNDGYFTLNGTATADNAFTFQQAVGGNPTFITGHKYIIRGGNRSKQVDIYSQGLGVNTYPDTIYTKTSASSSGSFTAGIKNGVTYDNYKGYLQVFDLTAMYGAGNEPATAAEFDAQYPKEYYAYTPTPVLLSSNIAGIEGASSCEFAAQTLRGIGTAQDVMTREGIERNIGVVDLGSLDWILSGTNSSGVYRVESSGIYQVAKKPTAGNVTPNIRCALYETKTADSTYLKNKGISLNTAGYIEVYDPDYNTADSAAAFKAAMSGVMLQYELATPTAETFTEPIDLTYSVQAGGSESWIIPDGTAPTSAAVTGEIAYPLNPARAFITHESFADFIDKLGAYISATITETWDGSKYTYAFASGRSALLGSIEAEPETLEVTEKDDIVKEIIEDERKEQ